MAATMKDAAKEQRESANRYYSGLGPCTGIGSPKASCLSLEEERPLTRTEKKLGWSRRPFYAYDVALMCPGCAVYWHTENAAQCAERAVRLAEVYSK